MRLEEMDDRYPNGLDGAWITGIAIDYEARTATVQLNMRGNPPDSPKGEDYGRAVLTLQEFFYFSIEPPDFDHQAYSKRGILVEGLPEDPSKFPLFEKITPDLPLSAFSCRFYVHDWNSFIHIAAKNAELLWSDSKF